MDCLLRYNDTNKFASMKSQGVREISVFLDDFTFTHDYVNEMK